MFSHYYSDQRLAGLKIALEEPEKIHFISATLALFPTNDRVYRIDRSENEWVCDCPTYQTMNQAGLSPICLHSIATARIWRDREQKTSWLYQASNKNHLLAQDAAIV